MKINVNVKLGASKSLVQLVTILAAALSGSALSQASYSEEAPDLKDAEPMVKKLQEAVAPQSEASQPEAPAPPAKTGTRKTNVMAPVAAVQESDEKDPNPVKIVDPVKTADEAIAEEEQGVIPTPEAKPEEESAPAKQYDVVEVRSILTQLMGDDNVKKLKAREILLSFGTKSVTELSADKYAAFVEKAKAELK